MAKSSKLGGKVRKSTTVRILLIDDDLHLGALLEELLSSKGFRVDLAYDGEEGAPKGEDADRIKGLEHGADDYLSKPFNLRELLLRVGAILRRSSRIESTVTMRHDRP